MKNNIDAQLANNNDFTYSKIARFDFYTKQGVSLVTGANGNIYVCEIGTGTRYQDQNGYKTTQEAIDAANNEIKSRQVVVTEYENGMISTPGAEEFFGQFFDAMDD